MKKIIALTGFLLILMGQVRAQSDDYRKIWAVLGEVVYKGDLSDVLTLNMETPDYSTEILALEGKEITIEGYLLPLDFGGSYFVISSTPFATCFFCGGAGPETVMEVYLEKGKKPAGKSVIVKGKLKLNRGELEHLTYMLENAKLIATK